MYMCFHVIFFSEGECEDYMKIPSVRESERIKSKSKVEFGLFSHLTIMSNFFPLIPSPSFLLANAVEFPFCDL